MVVLPADKRVRLGPVSRMLDRERLRLADENRIATLFADCDRGAAPAFGMAWGVETIARWQIISPIHPPEFAPNGVIEATFANMLLDSQ